MDGTGEIRHTPAHRRGAPAAGPESGCGCGPWITLALLTPAGSHNPGYYRCPDRHCLHAAPITAGRIADHDHGRNMAGPCPWVGTRVAATPPPCGCGPIITTRHLRIVCRYRGHPGAAITAVSCPGGCTNLAPVRDGYIAAHRSCLWAGVRVRDAGMYPPVLAMPR